MSNQVYITKISKFLPNEPVLNEEMETVLGMVSGKPSRSKNIILRQNGIKKRYYVINKEGTVKYSNAEITANAVKELENQGFSLNDLEVLSCGTSIADQLLPSHASMVHGKIKTKPVEIFSPSGVCCAGMHALKYAYINVLAGQSKNAVCTGSEVISTLLKADKFNKEAECLKRIEENPILAFEKDFLRWMLSDGAGAMLLQDKPNSNGLSLRIEWLETISFANEHEACMYAGAEKNGTGDLKGWKELDPEIWLEKSIFSVKQDVKLLDKNVVGLGIKKLAEILKKYKVNQQTEVDYFLPHLSSMFFKQKVYDELVANGIEIPAEKWFTNLTDVGNVGAASIYLMLEELFNSGRLKKGNRILILVPESGRFSYAYTYLTVV
ncbi:MAG: beta-ketoacyl-ACP synthase III [Bacteroidales bacterium]|jgi:3-oxoacyl-[acyl-carrier-protein] synthase-3|nr:beta-ketoacyl-ACP synthase III [Bacteroidales bacterium]